jgi:hypothetical protein
MTPLKPAPNPAPCPGTRGACSSRTGGHSSLAGAADAPAPAGETNRRSRCPAVLLDRWAGIVSDHEGPETRDLTTLGSHDGHWECRRHAAAHNAPSAVCAAGLTRDGSGWHSSLSALLSVLCCLAPHEHLGSQWDGEYDWRAELCLSVWETPCTLGGMSYRAWAVHSHTLALSLSRASCGVYGPLSTRLTANGRVIDGLPQSFGLRHCRPAGRCSAHWAFEVIGDSVPLDAMCTIGAAVLSDIELYDHVHTRAAAVLITAAQEMSCHVITLVPCTAASNPRRDVTRVVCVRSQELKLISRRSRARVRCHTDTG